MQAGNILLIQTKNEHNNEFTVRHFPDYYEGQQNIVEVGFLMSKHKVKFVEICAEMVKIELAKHFEDAGPNSYRGDINDVVSLFNLIVVNHISAYPSYEYAKSYIERNKPDESLSAYGYYTTYHEDAFHEDSVSVICSFYFNEMVRDAKYINISGKWYELNNEHDSNATFQFNRAPLRKHRDDLEIKSWIYLYSPENYYVHAYYDEYFRYCNLCNIELLDRESLARYITLEGYEVQHHRWIKVKKTVPSSIDAVESKQSKQQKQEQPKQEPKQKQLKQKNLKTIKQKITKSMEPDDEGNNIVNTTAFEWILTNPPGSTPVKKYINTYLNAHNLSREYSINFSHYMKYCGYIELDQTYYVHRDVLDEAKRWITDNPPKGTVESYYDDYASGYEMAVSPQVFKFIVYEYSYVISDGKWIKPTQKKQQVEYSEEQQQQQQPKIEIRYVTVTSIKDQMAAIGVARAIYACNPCNANTELYYNLYGKGLKITIDQFNQIMMAAGYAIVDDKWILADHDTFSRLSDWEYIIANPPANNMRVVDYYQQYTAATKTSVSHINAISTIITLLRYIIRDDAIYCSFCTASFNFVTNAIKFMRTKLPKNVTVEDYYKSFLNEFDYQHVPINMELFKHILTSAGYNIALDSWYRTGLGYQVPQPAEDTATTKFPNDPLSIAYISNLDTSGSGSYVYHTVNGPMTYTYFKLGNIGSYPIYDGTQYIVEEKKGNEITEPIPIIEYDAHGNLKTGDPITERVEEPKPMDIQDQPIKEQEPIEEQKQMDKQEPVEEQKQQEKKLVPHIRKDTQVTDEISVGAMHWVLGNPPEDMSIDEYYNLYKAYYNDNRMIFLTKQSFNAIMSELCYYKSDDKWVVYESDDEAVMVDHE